MLQDPQSLDLGPYRIEKLLGRGGLGEVYEAWDERLQRSVAVKRLRPVETPVGGSPADAGARAESPDPTSLAYDSRRRLRREARAAARLDHPAIVRIYDLLERPDGDWIVMERIQGETLAHRLARTGPLNFEESLALAEQLADGLAYAHSQGLVHRDLKTENVMVTDRGEAKVLDFGLAWNDTDSTTDSISRPDALVGTLRAMAPEQVLGRPVDHRSDLFSFGVLLYEALTAQSPFLQATVAETVARLCTHRQPSVAELRPEVPDDLSRLVQRLLEKDPSCRPQDSGQLRRQIQALGAAASRSTAAAYEEVPLESETLAPGGAKEFPEAPPAGPMPAETSKASRPTLPTSLRPAALSLLMMGLLVLAGILFWKPKAQGPSEALKVALMPIRSQGLSDGPEARLPAALSLGLERALIALEGVDVLLPESTPGTPAVFPVEDFAEASQSPGQTYVGAAIETLLDCTAGRCQITLRRLEGDYVVSTEGFTLPSPEPFLAIEALSIYARRLFPAPTQQPQLPLPAPKDLDEYLSLRKGYEEGLWDGREIELLDRVSSLRQSSPTFIEAHIFETDLVMSPALRNAARQAHAGSLLVAAQRLAPHDERPLFAGFRFAIRVGDLDRAEEMLTLLEGLRPGAPELLADRASLAWSRGNTQEALEIQGRAARLWPTQSNLFRLASFEARAGLRDSARTSLETLLARDPEHLGGLRLLGQLELLSGDPDRAAERYRSLAHHRPSFSVWANLGTAYLLAGHLEDASEAFEAALELRPGSAGTILGLADVRQFQGREKESRRLYEGVLLALEENPDGASGPAWQPLTIKAQALAHLGRPIEAAQAVREALRLAPDEPQLAYESSLIYALLGEESSAIANGRRALELGIAPSWFRLPWFDDLRPSLDENGEAALISAATP